MGFERNPMKSYRELDNPVLLLDTFCLFLLNKQNTRSDRYQSLCQFEWWRGDSRVIVSRTLLNSFYFSIHFACFFKTNKTLEVTSIILSVRVISWDSKEISWNRIENSTSLSYFSIHPLEADTRSDIEATLCQFEPAYQGTQAGDFMGFERNLMKSYRELDLTHLTSRYILLVFSKQTKHSKWHWSNTLSVRVMERRQPSHCIENSINPVLLLDTIFYRKSPAFQGTQAGSKWHWSSTLSVRVISWDSKEISWNRIENST